MSRELDELRVKAITEGVLCLAHPCRTSPSSILYHLVTKYKQGGINFLFDEDKLNKISELHKEFIIKTAYSYIDPYPVTTIIPIIIRVISFVEYLEKMKKG